MATLPATVGLVVIAPPVPPLAARFGWSSNHLGWFDLPLLRVDLPRPVWSSPPGVSALPAAPDCKRGRNGTVPWPASSAITASVRQMPTPAGGNLFAVGQTVGQPTRIVANMSDRAHASDDTLACIPVRRFCPDTEEVTGSNPVSPTSNTPSHVAFATASTPALLHVVSPCQSNC